MPQTRGEQAPGDITTEPKEVSNMHPIVEQVILFINTHLGNLIHLGSSGSSNLSYTLGMF